MRQTKRLVTLMAVLLIAACTDNGIFNPLNNASGTYQLTVYAGRSMPNATFIIQPGDPNYPNYPNGATQVVTDGTITLRSDGTFSETNNYAVTPNGSNTPDHITFARIGTWTLNGQDFTLNVPSQNGYNGFVDFGTLIEGADGRMTINYQEQNGSGGFDSYEYKM